MKQRMDMDMPQLMQSIYNSPLRVCYMWHNGHNNKGKDKEKGGRDRDSKKRYGSSYKRPLTRKELDNYVRSNHAVGHVGVPSDHSEIGLYHVLESDMKHHHSTQSNREKKAEAARERKAVLETSLLMQLRMMRLKGTLPGDTIKVKFVDPELVLSRGALENVPKGTRTHTRQYSQ